MVKQGYKQTDVGLIPEDWDCAKIEDIATISMCKRIFADQTTENGEIPFYKIGTFGKEADAYISRSLYTEYRSRFSFPEKGDVLISAAGTLGRTVVYDGKDAYFQDSNIVWLDIDKNALCNEYLNHYYRVIKWASSEGSTIARLYNGIIYATNIALPPLDEQNRIAEALSDVDNMISSFEKLIAKKKAIKQGAMQELLTGKMRLPSFDEEWKSILLEDVCVFYNGGTPSKKRSDWWNGCIPWISSSDLCENSITSVSINRYITQDALDHSATHLCPKNAVSIVSRVGVGKVAVTPCELCTSQDFTTIVSSAHNPYFLAYMLVPIMKDMAMQAQGTSIKGITVEDIAKIKISTPSIKEQNQIVSILSDMDNEIEALEQKLAKTRQIKQGMMQQLLSGSIRLMHKEVQP